MDDGTWNRLSVAQQSAVKSLSKKFIKAVQASTADNGWEFGEKYSVQTLDGEYIISDGITPLPGIAHHDRQVLEALMTDAIQNYGR